MTRYKVVFWLTTYGSTIIEAKSEKEAEDKIYKEIQDNSLDNLTYQQFDRDYNTEGAEVVDND